MDALVNRPNRVLEIQKKLQSNPAFMHQKMPRAKLYMRTYLILWSVGLGGALYGTFNMARGVGKIPKSAAA